MAVEALLATEAHMLGKGLDAHQLKRDDGADGLAGMHQVKGVIDLLDRHDVRDERIDLDLAIHVPVDDPRHVGATARASEGGPLPDASGHQLERPGADFLTRSGHPDDDGLAPATVAALQRLTHHVDVADAFERVVSASVRQRDKVRHEVTLDFLRIDEVRHAEFGGQCLTGRIQVNADDLVRPCQPCALDHVQTDAAETEDHHVGARLDLRRVDHGTDPRGDTAADVADLLEGRVRPDLRKRNFRQHGIVRERRAAHIVMHHLAIQREAARAIRHHALALGGADRSAEVGLVGSAILEDQVTIGGQAGIDAAVLITKCLIYYQAVDGVNRYNICP